MVGVDRLDGEGGGGGVAGGFCGGSFCGWGCEERWGARRVGGGGVGRGRELGG